MVYTIDKGLVKEQIGKFTLFLLAVAFAAVASLGLFKPAQAASTVTVTGETSAGENQPGWLFNRDPGTATPYEFSTDEASIGSGSLYVLPIGANASDKFIAENFINAPIADVDSISYDFLIGSGGTAADENEFYMNVYANFGESDDLKFYDCRYNVVPTIGSTAGFTTVTFDPTQAYPVTTRSGTSASPHACPAVPADMDSLSPGSNIRVFSLNVGDTNTNDVGLDGYLDNVVVTLNGDATTYDFERFLPAEIVSPAEGEEVEKGETLSLEAHDESATAGSVQWAVRAGTCAASTGTVAGNVDGFSDPSVWQDGVFTASVETDDLTVGDYCFVFNPTDGGRYTRLFSIVNNDPDAKDECKKGGWEDFGFRNQGLCIQYVNTGRDSR